MTDSESSFNSDYPMSYDEAVETLLDFDDRLKNGLPCRGIGAKAWKAFLIVNPDEKAKLDAQKERADSLLVQGKFTVTSGGVVVLNEVIEEEPFLFNIVMEDKSADREPPQEY